MVVILIHRFERLRGIIALRNLRIKELEQQAVELFEKGQLREIECLMQEKDWILNSIQQLSLFIEKWEHRTTQKEDHLYSSI